ncbi:hypothetical protein [Sandaracinus amylolyticus]|uniref:Uncharacterized protein n=1 Tax=Sandaracinus amylolyticus TaxID=927083 RepID=A0A0F6YGX6_9BACT|nr:hypothetical protein [Sandaracinus amylolyticus]AKF03363.1 hypothetical protein DB32_000512 [Sandaracinus amylolyticus]
MARRKDDDSKGDPRAPKPPRPQGSRERDMGVVRRRPDDPRKRLPSELEAFARGDDDALWRRERSRGRVNDPRPVAATLVPGVANRDARIVCDARIKRLRSAIDAGDEYVLAEELADAVRLGVWRGHKIVDFDVFAEAVLGLGIDRARALAQQGAAALDVPCEIADEQTVALWMRAESGLLEHAPESRVSLRGGRLVLEVPFARAAEALSGVGRRAAPLAKPQGGPDVVVDRPKGVPPLSRLIERDRPRDDE